MTIVTCFEFGGETVTMRACDRAVASATRDALGLEFGRSCDPPGSAETILFTRAAQVTFAAGRLEVGLAAADLSRAVRLYYDFVESSLVVTAAKLGYVAVHGASVVLGRDLVVLVGARGAGKSTNSLALMAAGGVLVSDDATFIRPNGQSLDVAALPREIHADRALCSTWLAVANSDGRAGYSGSNASKLAVARSELGRTATSLSIPVRNVHLVFLDAAPSGTQGGLVPCDDAPAVGLDAHFMAITSPFRGLHRTLEPLQGSLCAALSTARHWRFFRPAMPCTDPHYPRCLARLFAPIGA